MKRCWIGAGMLAALLLLSGLVSWGMEKMHTPIVHALVSAADAAQAGDWDRAAELAASAEAEWEEWHHLRSCFADHTPTEEIDAKFAVLKAWTREGIPGEFAALASETAQMVTAMGDAHGLSWGDFF